jgi:hypothetical protein
MGNRQDREQSLSGQQNSVIGQGKLEMDSARCCVETLFSRKRTERSGRKIIRRERQRERERERERECNEWYCLLSTRQSPQWVMASSFSRFLDHTRHTTVGKAPLDE